jgi:hypothetical protein
MFGAQRKGAMRAVRTVSMEKTGTRTRCSHAGNLARVVFVALSGLPDKKTPALRLTF